MSGRSERSDVNEAEVLFMEEQMEAMVAASQQLNTQYQSRGRQLQELMERHKACEEEITSLEDANRSLEDGNRALFEDNLKKDALIERLQSELSKSAQ